MPKRLDIDRIFKEVAQKNEQPYRPQDWEDFQKVLLREMGNEAPSGVSRILNYFRKTYLMAALIALILIPFGRLNLNEEPPQSEAREKTTQSTAINDTQSTPNQEDADGQRNIPNTEEKPYSPQNMASRQPEEPTTPIEGLISKENAQPVPEKQNGVSSHQFNKTTTEVLPRENTPEITFVEPKNRETLPSEVGQTLSTSSGQLESLESSPIVLEDIQTSLREDQALTQIITYPVPNLLDAHHQDTSFHPCKRWHLGFIYPLSTNLGRLTPSDFSIHALIGVDDATHDLALAGLAHINKEDNKGFQVAGLTNVTWKKQKGTQVAGLFNVSGEQVAGTQWAGLINVSGFRPPEMMPSLPNASLEEEPPPFQGQVGGLVNFSLDKNTDLQLAGLTNVASRVSGAQVAGLINVAGEVEGIQLGGLINIARKVTGVQLGLINVADSVEGVPIGLLSIVKKNGYRRLEFWGSATFHSNVSAKFGTKKFYNIFSLGSQYATDDFRWGLGYGFGSHLNLRRDAFADIDLIAYHINENRTFTKKLNLLTQFKVSLGKQVGNHFGLYAGPTLNVLWSDFRNSDNSIGSRIAPWTFLETQIRNTRVKIWAGFHVGVRFGK